MIFSTNFPHYRNYGQKNCLVRLSGKNDINENIADIITSF
ncbi:hypothetical protein M104_1119 [Bacteroides fragilis str. 1007-1-F |uniref:Uncharacterized protein n=2 Tax=Bacteroides fragilis TaxID=817 RepID=A0AAN4N1U7_BACFG|nr:hypothetical protein M147_4763 [Bacteroides fragilis str. 1007-1-F \